MKPQQIPFLSRATNQGFVAAMLVAATCAAGLAQEEPEIPRPPTAPASPKTPPPPASSTTAVPAAQYREIQAAARAQDRAAKELSRTYELDDKLDLVIPRTGPPVLIIPKDAGQAGKGASEADQEDWQIMERILEKA